MGGPNKAGHSVAMVELPDGCRNICYTILSTFVYV